MVKKLEQLEEKLAALQNQVNKEKRRVDTRRKILFGATVEAALRDGKISEETWQRLLNRYIKRKSDRDFLDLPRLDEVNMPPVDT